MTGPPLPIREVLAEVEAAIGDSRPLGASHSGSRVAWVPADGVVRVTLDFKAADFLATRTAGLRSLGHLDEGGV